jgi:hypothetical protein
MISSHAPSDLPVGGFCRVHLIFQYFCSHHPKSNLQPASQSHQRVSIVTDAEGARATGLKAGCARGAVTAEGRGCCRGAGVVRAPTLASVRGVARRLDNLIRRRRWQKVPARAEPLSIACGNAGTPALVVTPCASITAHTRPGIRRSGTPSKGRDPSTPGAALEVVNGVPDVIASEAKQSISPRKEEWIASLRSQ